MHSLESARSLSYLVVEIPCSSGKEALDLAESLVELAGTKVGREEYGPICEVAAYVGEEVSL